MKYNIVSINDDRLDYKNNIRARVGLEEIHIPAVDALKVNLDKELEKRNLKVLDPPGFAIGEIGVWLSMFDCWKWCAEHEDLVVFEDDCRVAEDFNGRLERLIGDAPEDWDYISLWPPDNQRSVYEWNVAYDAYGKEYYMSAGFPDIKSQFYIGSPILAKIYQGYSCVATLYSKAGAQKLVDRALEENLYMPVDTWLHALAHRGYLNGFSPRPNACAIVTYDWPKTQVHETIRFTERNK